MKFKQRLGKITFFLILFVCLVISCSKETKQYKIGVIGPLSGEGATYGAAMKRGIDLAMKEINKKGGIKGGYLAVIYEDSKLRPMEGINAFNKLVQVDKVQVIIGAAASRVTLAIAPLAQKNKIVVISSISTSDNLRKFGDFVFRNVPSNSIQGKTGAYFIIQRLKKHKVAIFYKNDEYGKDLAKSFKENFLRLGGEILLEESYQPREKNFKTKLLKIKSFSPEVIYFPGNYQESALILKQANELGISAIFVGGDGSYSPELIKIAGEAAEGSYYTIMALPQEKNEKFKKFLVNFKKKYNMLPGIYDVYSYDALYVIAEAIKNVGYDAKKVAKFLHATTFNGVSGKIKFTKYGDVDKPYAVYIIKNGKFKRVDWNPIWK